jgi:hypothetical protein
MKSSSLKQRIAERLLLLMLDAVLALPPPNKASRRLEARFDRVHEVLSQERDAMLTWWRERVEEQ